VTYTDGRVEIEEIKPAYIVQKVKLLEELRKENASEEDIREAIDVSDSMYKVIQKTLSKFSAARQHYAENGTTYKIMTENEIDVRLADYSSITKSSKREEANARRRAKYHELKTKTTLPSKLYNELKQQPFIDEEQALDAYKNIYSDELNQWKDTDLDC
jgi:hypothetical protein